MQTAEAGSKRQAAEGSRTQAAEEHSMEEMKCQPHLVFEI
jgi:hypothetical protein